jgi:hypothetical protein
MLETTNILMYLKENKLRLMDEYHLTKIGLFGSYGRMEQSDASDIDLAVEFKPGTENLHSLKYKLKSEIQAAFGLPVDICRIKYIKPIFREQIDQDIQYV